MTTPDSFQVPGLPILLSQKFLLYMKQREAEVRR